MDPAEPTSPVLACLYPVSFSAQQPLTCKFKVTGELRLPFESSFTANWCSKRSSSIFGPQRASVSRCTCGGSSSRSPENYRKKGAKSRRLDWLVIKADLQEMKLNPEWEGALRLELFLTTVESTLLNG